MINLYELLGLSHKATESEIKQAIAKHYADGTIQENILSKAKEWLLNPNVRAKYDAKLLQEYPNLATERAIEPPKIYANLYDFLGVAFDASDSEIEDAISNLQQQGADARQLNLAKNYLLNKDRRKKYNQDNGLNVSQAKSKLPKMKPKSTGGQNQHPQQVVVKNTGCFGVAGGIILALVIIVLAPIVLLGMCTAGTVAAVSSKASESKSQEVMQPDETTAAPAKPNSQAVKAFTKEQEVCSQNDGFKSCYGLAFECNDGAKIKPEKAYCMSGAYMVDGADENISQADEKLQNAKLDLCEKLATAARAAMSARQKGIPKADAMDIAKKNPIVASLVNDAYKQPILETEALKRNSIDLYENSMHRQCLDTM